MILGRNLLASCSYNSNHEVDFFHIPSATKKKRRERWGIPRLPFEASCYTAYPPENILVASELKGW